MWHFFAVLGNVAKIQKDPIWETVYHIHIKLHYILEFIYM